MVRELLVGELLSNSSTLASYRTEYEVDPEGLVILGQYCEGNPGGVRAARGGYLLQGVGCSGDPGAKTRGKGGGGRHGGLSLAWLGSSSLFLLSVSYLFGFALVYLFVHFLLTEASVNDIVVLNSTLGTLLCPCFGLFPLESEVLLSGPLWGWGS